MTFVQLGDGTWICNRCVGQGRGPRDICSDCKRKNMEKKETWGVTWFSGGSNILMDYFSEESARSAAERVAKNNPGVSISVFQVRASVVLGGPVWTEKA